MKKTSLLTFALTCALPIAAHAADTPSMDGPLTIAKQGSFFVGGREVKSDALSTVPLFGATGTITVDQMYVRYQIPTQPKDYSVVLIHGCCLTGKSWETTPRRPDGLGRIFPAPRLLHLCRGPGLAWPIGREPGRHEHGEDRQVRAGLAACLHRRRP